MLSADIFSVPAAMRGSTMFKLPKESSELELSAFWFVPEVGWYVLSVRC